jgi:glucose/arabinose dehydrogenase
MTRPGFQVVVIDPQTKRAVPFVRNVRPGPASRQAAKGRGVERPYDVKFGPDGAMYIADYGILNVNPARIREGQVPYEAPPRSGAIWKVTPVGHLG